MFFSFNIVDTFISPTPRRWTINMTNTVNMLREHRLCLTPHALQRIFVKSSVVNIPSSSGWALPHKSSASASVNFIEPRVWHVDQDLFLRLATVCFVLTVIRLTMDFLEILPDWSSSFLKLSRIFDSLSSIVCIRLKGILLRSNQYL